MRQGKRWIVRNGDCTEGREGKCQTPESTANTGADIISAHVDVDMVADISECAVDTSIAGPIIFSACSVKRYKKIRVGLAGDFGNIALKKVKSHYAISRDRPLIFGSILTPSRELYNRITYEPIAIKTFDERLAINAIKLDKGHNITVAP